MPTTRPSAPAVPGISRWPRPPLLWRKVRILSQAQVARIPPTVMSNRMGITLQITSIPQTLSNSRRNRRRSPTRSPSPRASSRVGTRWARSPPPPTANRPSARRRPRWAARRRASSPTRRPACCPRLARIAYRCRDVFRKSPVESNSIPKFKTQIGFTSYSMQCPKIHVLSMSNIMCDFSSHFY